MENKQPLILGIAAVAIIGVAVLLLNKPAKQESAMVNPSPAAMEQTAATSAPSAAVSDGASPEAMAPEKGTYTDGEYTGEGSYTSPAGQENVTLVVTLEGNNITDATFTTDTQNETSKKYQTMFIENFKTMVVGKNIDEVKLDKVSGSSLTSGGFNSALENIKTQAQG